MNANAQNYNPWLHRFIRGDRGRHVFVARLGRHGHQPRSRHVRAGLAEHLRLQHVFVPGFKMGRRHFLRTYAPPAGLRHRPFDDRPRRLALVQGFAQMDALARRARVCAGCVAGRARRPARDAGHGQARHRPRRARAIVLRFDLRAGAVHQPLVAKCSAGVPPA